MDRTEAIKKYGTEAKVKASSLAAFVAGLVVTGFLAGTATDFARELPDWIEVGALSAIQAAIVFVTGYSKRNSGGLSQSTYERAEKYLRDRGLLK